MCIHQTDWRYWPAFEPHHYLTLPHMIAATNYVATILPGRARIPLPGAGTMRLMIVGQKWLG
jgi:hypothetical protein